MCSAIHTKSRSWLRSSSTREPSDPLLRVVRVLIPAPSPGRSSYCVQRKCSGTTTPRKGKQPPTNLQRSMVRAVRHLGRAPPCQRRRTSTTTSLPGNRTPSGMRSSPRARRTRRLPTRGIAARSKKPLHPEAFQPTSGADTESAARQGGRVSLNLASASSRDERPPSCRLAAGKIRYTIAPASYIRSKWHFRRAPHCARLPAPVSRPHPGRRKTEEIHLLLSLATKGSIMIHPLVHRRVPCYDFYFL